MPGPSAPVQPGPTTFSTLKVDHWRQFREVSIRFHRQLTIITGANGAGKSTLLQLLNRHFGWHQNFVGTSQLATTQDKRRYTTDWWLEDALESMTAGVSLEPLGPGPHGEKLPIGSIQYSDGVTGILLVSAEEVNYVYDVAFTMQSHVEGLAIPSHRPQFNFQQVQSIPTQPRRRNEVFNQYRNLVQQRLQGGHTQFSPHYYMKETLIALATFGYGSHAVVSDPESARIFEGFEQILHRMLPTSLGFLRLRVIVPDVVLETRSGHFSIDAVSGGVSAIIELAWQIFMFEPSGKRFVVTIDEPENHLHPQLQKRVLSDLISAFPNVQFIVATHSPFVIGSVPDSNVFVLDYDESNKICSAELDTVNKAGSANEILREVLGLDSTWPVWVSAKLDEIVRRYSELDFTDASMHQLRQEMQTLGMENYIPQTIAQVAANKED